MTERNQIYFFHNEPSDAKITALLQLAEKYHFQMVPDPKDANIIISIGGDGTFLQAVRKTNFRQDCLYAGITVQNELGLYCDFYLNHVSSIIDAITQEKIEVRRYPVLKASIDGQGSFYCLNEFSIRSGIIKTFEMDVFIDDIHFETFRGDGMLIATPTGSTAYNKSVGGAVVDPLLPCLQVSEIASLNNFKYRTLGSSFILDGSRKLTLKVAGKGNEYPLMGMDNEALSIRHVDRVEVTLSDKMIKTVKLKDNSFWEKVKRTFL